MNTDIQDTFALARRLADLQEQPPPPLRIHLADRPRDGPRGCPDPFRPIERATGQMRPSQRISELSYRSRGKS